MNWIEDFQYFVTVSKFLYPTLLREIITAYILYFISLFLSSGIQKVYELISNYVEENYTGNQDVASSSLLFTSDDDSDCEYKRFDNELLQYLPRGVLENYIDTMCAKEMMTYNKYLKKEQRLKALEHLAHVILLSRKDNEIFDYLEHAENYYINKWLLRPILKFHDHLELRGLRKNPIREIFKTKSTYQRYNH